MNGKEEVCFGRVGYFICECMVVFIFFFINGLIMGVWVLKILEFVSCLGLDFGVFGIMILIMGVGLLILMFIIGI